MLAAGFEVDLDALRRNLYASASCGICGKATLENVLREAPALDDASRFPASLFYALPSRLSGEQDRAAGSAFFKELSVSAAATVLPSSDFRCLPTSIPSPPHWKT